MYKSAITTTLSIILYALSTLPAIAVETGTEFTVPSWEWVTIMNPEGVQQKYVNGIFLKSLGDMCAIEEGGVVRVINTDEKHGVLVRYTAPGKQLGTQCPSGTLFFAEAETLTNYAKAETESIEDKKDLIRRLLSGQ